MMMEPHLNVLLVENCPDDNSLTQSLLAGINELSFDLVGVSTSAAAIAALRQKRYDICLLDSQIGDCSGLDLLETFVSEGYKIPTILLTDRGDRATDLAAMQAGAADYLVKGKLDPPMLERSIRYAMHRACILSALQEREEQYALAALGANDGLWDWNLQTKAVYFSPRWKTMLGCEGMEIGTTIDDWLNRIHPEDLERFKSEILAHLQGKTESFQVEHRILHKSGVYRWVLGRGLAVRANDQATRMAGSLTDLTSRRTLYDELTGLPNRALFLDQLERARRRTERQPDYQFAVLFLDFDRFKVINDSLGHLLGDRLLVNISQRLEASVRSADIIARLGGDEYAILLERVNHINEVTQVAQRINQLLKEPFNLDGYDVFVTASIGIATNSPDCDRAEDLLRNADTAMYRAKALGKARYVVFDSAMHVAAQKQLRIETDLQRAIEHEEFFLVYQPILSLVTNRIVGLEALVRWQHPQRGTIAPIEFIPVAEETGSIVFIGLWVLQHACRQMQAWRQQFPACQSLEISVNLSRKQFSQPNLVEQIDQILQQTGLPPHCLKLEITETTITDNTSAAKLLARMKALGVQLHIDDFGTGQSSLSCLHTFPIDTLKVDRSFVHRMTSESENAEIVRTIVTLAHNLGMDAVAEGVETTEQLAQLKALHCDRAQGYLFSKPLAPDAVATLLATAESALPLAPQGVERIAASASIDPTVCAVPSL
jgi:diguanylate cyclase (GGDEF)-like protein/PAS domain S-box-containing protein